MRILLISPIEPYPPDGGWPIVVYNDILGLRALGHDVVVLVFGDQHRGIAANDPLKDICRVERFFHSKRPRWVQVLRNIGKALPYTVARYTASDLVEAGVNLHSEQAFDVIVSEDVVTAEAALAVSRKTGVPFVIRGHNISSMVASRYVEDVRNPVVRFLANRQLQKFRTFENRLYQRADRVCQITTVDAETMARLFPDAAEAEVIGVGADLEYMKTDGTTQRDPSLIVHVGSLTEFTKLEGMQWFCREVLPQVIEHCPDARLQLVGGVAAEAFPEDSEVMLEGRVDDVRPYLWAAGVFVAPQFVGSGIRLKILNAMAAGVPIVCTGIACEGIGIEDGKHALIRETPGEYAEAVVALLKDREMATHMASCARRYVEEHFDWRYVCMQLATVLESVVKKR